MKYKTKLRPYYVFYAMGSNFLFLMSIILMKKIPNNRSFPILICMILFTLYNFFILFVISVTVHEMSGFWIFCLGLLAFFVLLGSSIVCKDNTKRTGAYLVSLFNVFVNIHSLIILNYVVKILLSIVLVFILGIIYAIFIHVFDYNNIKPGFARNSQKNDEE